MQGAWRAAMAAAAVLFLFALGPGCEEPPPLPPLVESPVLDTSYVQIFPSFPGFRNPQDVMVGNDQLLYVADTDSNRVVMMNRAGQVLSTRRVLRPVSLAQDTRLDLLVGGEIVVDDTARTGAIFRLHLVDAGHRLETARIETVWTELAFRARRFPGLTVFGDNTWLAVRNGPDNSSFVDPDARVLLFRADDEFVTPVPAFTSSAGGSITNINHPTGIAGFASSKDFVLVQSAEGVAYQAVWMRYESSAEFEGWLLKFDPARIEDRDVDFLQAGRFILPEGVAVDPARRDVFIADATLDSVVKFNARGRFKPESFGMVRTGGAMMRPTGLAYFEKILYVLDGAKGEVIRFRLSTDVPR